MKLRRSSLALALGLSILTLSACDRTKQADEVEIEEPEEKGTSLQQPPVEAELAVKKEVYLDPSDYYEVSLEGGMDIISDIYLQILAKRSEADFDMDSFIQQHALESALVDDPEERKRLLASAKEVRTKLAEQTLPKKLAISIVPKTLSDELLKKRALAFSSDGHEVMGYDALLGGFPYRSEFDRLCFGPNAKSSVSIGIPTRPGYINVGGKLDLDISNRNLSTSEDLCLFKAVDSSLIEEIEAARDRDALALTGKVYLNVVDAGPKSLRLYPVASEMYLHIKQKNGKLSKPINVDVQLSPEYAGFTYDLEDVE